VTLAEALGQATALGLTRLDGQLLLLHALGRAQGDRAWLLAHDTDPAAPEVQSAFLGLCQRRAGGEPLAYLVGRKEFFGLDLRVDRRVLVPRPDTETLVEWALAVLAGHPGRSCDPGLDAAAGPRVADLGTGSGAIALAIKNNCLGARVDAVDFSADALEIARWNARALGLDIHLREASWLQDCADSYDLVVSNPPYVAAGDTHLAALTHEPLQALAAGPDGLDDIRTIISQAPARLRPGGWLLLEHGHDQAAKVRELLAGAGFRAVGSRRDLAGIERCSGGKWLERG